MKYMSFLVVFGFLTVPVAFAENVSILPEHIVQGDPILVTITASSSVVSVSFEGKRIPTFNYKNQTSAFIPIDLSHKAGDFSLTFRLANNETATKIVSVALRDKPKVPLGIPEKLGGNTAASQKNLVSSLAKENATLANIKTGIKAFWQLPFRAPVADPIITDTYGYSRLTGVYTIAHKGTDFRASIGTKVMAMNRGVVRIARAYGVYGKTIVIDHGLGVQTLYMHLSKIKVNEGELVLPGQIIGLSGDTGYAEHPHLHLSIKIAGISIDPAVFLSFFKK